MKDNWDEHDLDYFKKMIGIVNRGYYLDSKQLCELYNRVFNKDLRPTGCSSCNKLRYSELKTSYDRYVTEKVKEEKNDSTEGQEKV